MLKEKLKERAKIRRVEKAIKRSKKLEEQKKLEREIRKKAEEIARKYGVSKDEALAYVRAQLRKKKKAESLERTRAILAKLGQAGQIAEAFSAGAFAQPYEQSSQYQTKKPKTKTRAKRKSQKSSKKSKTQTNAVGIDTGNILQYTRKIL